MRLFPSKRDRFKTSRKRRGLEIKTGGITAKFANIYKTTKYTKNKFKSYP